MSTTFQNLRNVKLVQSQSKGWIDRQKSLKMVRLAELSLTKKRLATSSQKNQLSFRQQVQERKDKIIHQIRDKLSNVEKANLNIANHDKQVTSEGSNVVRLERLLDKIKKERNYTFQPSIVHRRQVINLNKGSRPSSRRNRNLQQMLKEVTEAREEVKLIKQINSTILGNCRSYNFAQKNLQNCEDQFYSTVDRTIHQNNHIWREKGYQDIQRPQQSKNYLNQNQQIISTSSLLAQSEKNDYRYRHPSNFSHTNHPSQNIYSWTLQKEEKSKKGSESFTIIPLEGLKSK